MTSEFKYLNSPTLMGSWPMAVTGLGGPSGGQFTLFPKSLVSQATILGSRKQPAGGFVVDGESFILTVDDNEPYTIDFSSEPLSIDNVVLAINSQVGGIGAVAYNNNGFLLLKSPTIGDTIEKRSYLKITLVPASLNILPELGLFSGAESYNGELVQAQHIDPSREIATFKQLALNYGEQFDANTYNRVAFQLAINTDRSNNFIDYKRVAIEQDTESNLDPYVAGSNPGLVLPYVVFLGKDSVPPSDPPTSARLEQLFAVLDEDGNELLQDVQTLDGITSGAETVTLSVNADTKVQYVEVSAGIEFKEGDPAANYFVKLTGIDGGIGDDILFKIKEFVSSTKVGIENTDPATGDVIEIVEGPVNSIRASRILITPTKVIVVEVDDSDGGSRVEGVAQTKVTTTDITRIEGNNRVVCNDSDFNDAGVVVGDQLIIDSAAAASPYSNNGTYRISKIVDLHTVEVISDSYCPVILNSVADSGYGTATIQSDGQFFDSPFLKFNVHPDDDSVVRIVYLGLSNLRDASDDPSFAIGGAIKYRQETSFEVQKTLMAVIGPSTTSFKDYLYDDDRDSLEDIYFRVNKEHDTRGKHTTIHAGAIGIGAFGVTGHPAYLLEVVNPTASGIMARLMLKNSLPAVGGRSLCFGFGATVVGPFINSTGTSADNVTIGADSALATFTVKGMSQGYLYGKTTGQVMPAAAGSYIAALTLEDHSTSDTHNIGLTLRKSFEDSAATDRKISMVFTSPSTDPANIFGRISGGRASTTLGQGYLSFHAGADAAGVADHMILSSSGYLGIGKTPEVMLDVAGQSHITSSTAPPLLLERTSAHTTVGSTCLNLLATCSGDLTAGGPEINFFFTDTGITASLLGALGVVRDTNDTSGSFVFSPYLSNVKTERMRITRDGYVGIGTATPAKNLTIRKDVHGSIELLRLENLDTTTDTSASIVIEARLWDAGSGGSAKDAGHIVFGKEHTYSSDANSDSYMSFFTALNGTDTEKMRITADGYVGVGIAAPTSPLHVVGVSHFQNYTGASDPSGTFEFTTSDTNIVNSQAPVVIKNASTGNMADGFGTKINFGIKDSGADTIIGSIGAVRNGADTTGSLFFSTYLAGSPSEIMRITGTGQVGIGVTVPSYRIHVSDIAGGAANKQIGGMYISDLNSAHYTWLNIGRSSAANEGAGFGYYYQSGGTPAGHDCFAFICMNGENPITTGLHIKPGGDVYITQALGVYATITTATLNTGTVYSDSNGTLTNVAQSDIRLKRDVQAISDRLDVIDSLTKLRGVYFNWDKTKDEIKNSPNKIQMGVIAQEVENAGLQELVTTGIDGFKGLDYVPLIGFLIEVCKNLNARIDKLESGKKHKTLTKESA